MGTIQSKIETLLKIPQIIQLKTIFSTEIDNFYLVGGAVRNALLNIPIKDVDFATSYTPDELIALCKRKKITHIPTGLQYGTITIIIKNTAYEITSLREDIKTDGRHAVVTYTKDLKLDSKRRDFTFNALYIDFNGKLYDFHHGQSDLSKKQLKFIGNSNNRIKEDYLRILRLFRFYAELEGLSIDKNSLTAAINAKHHLNQLSAERIRQEFIRILSGKNYYNAIKLLAKYQICHEFVFLSDQLIKAISLYQKNNIFPPKHEILIAYAIMQEQEPQQELHRLKKRLQLSNKETSIIKAIISYHNNLPALLLSPIEIKKLLFLHGRDKLLILYYYQIFISSHNIANYHAIISQIKHLQIPKFPISGKHLIAEGIPEGEIIGKKLALLQKKWLDSNLSLSKRELLNSL